MLQFDKNYLTEYNQQFLVGCDEAGRGPLAGPLVVAGVVFPADFTIEGLTDSKKTLRKKTESIRT